MWRRFAFPSQLHYKRVFNTLVKAVDKVGRTARRSVDTHIKNTLSKPRIATALRRMTAMFNFVPDLPGISTVANTPDLTVEPVKSRTKASTFNIKSPTSPMQTRSPSPAAHKGDPEHPKMDVDSFVDETPTTAPEQPEAAGSATESEDDVPLPPQAKTSHEKPTSPTKPPSSRALSSTPAESPRPSRQVSAPRSPSPAPKSKGKTKVADSATESDESSKVPPKKTVKKKKVVSSDDGDDSDDVAVPKKPSGGAAVRRGARQPIKRGGKRF